MLHRWSQSYGFYLSNIRRKGAFHTRTTNRTYSWTILYDNTFDWMNPGDVLWHAFRLNRPTVDGVKWTDQSIMRMSIDQWMMRVRGKSAVKVNEEGDQRSGSVRESVNVERQLCDQRGSVMWLIGGEGHWGDQSDYQSQSGDTLGSARWPINDQGQKGVQSTIRFSEATKHRSLSVKWPINDHCQWSEQSTIIISKITNQRLLSVKWPINNQSQWGDPSPIKVSEMTSQ